MGPAEMSGKAGAAHNDRSERYIIIVDRFIGNSVVCCSLYRRSTKTERFKLKTPPRGVRGIAAEAARFMRP
jgi:hypothetical protein